MNKAMVVAVGVGVALAAAGCGGGDTSSSESESTPTTAAAPTLYRVGQEVDNGGIAVTVRGIRTEPSIGGPGGQAAPEGQTFVVLDAGVVNHTAAGIDLSCGKTVGNRLVDSQNRSFDTIPALDAVPGNRPCGDAVAPGADGQIQWVFAVPADSVPTGFGFYNTDTQQPSEVKVVDLTSS